jgi:predicted HAD superfamily Cof-like phosphohydrolase
MDIFKSVREFHEKFNLPIADKPQMLEKERFEFRCQLHHEEQKELEAAYEAADMVKIADGLGDLLFVVAGTCIEFGLPMGKILEAVMKANMAKVPSTPKPTKGPDWVGPEGEIKTAIGDF